MRTRVLSRPMRPMFSPLVSWIVAAIVFVVETVHGVPAARGRAGVSLGVVCLAPPDDRRQHKG
jgi:hypothetical protein